jgi:hypothetical protein
MISNKLKLQETLRKMSKPFPVIEGKAVTEKLRGTVAFWR